MGGGRTGEESEGNCGRVRIHRRVILRCVCIIVCSAKDRLWKHTTVNMTYNCTYVFGRKGGSIHTKENGVSELHEEQFITYVVNH